MGDWGGREGETAGENMLNTRDGELFWLFLVGGIKKGEETRQRDCLSAWWRMERSVSLLGWVGPLKRMRSEREDAV